MTRDELLTQLTAWRTPTTWTKRAFAKRDRLQFALWWYCRSTEAGKPDPTWPSAEYVALKIGGGPRYLDSIDDALGLVPAGLHWLVAAGRTRPTEPLYGAEIIDPIDDQPIAEAETNVAAAVAVCIAALKARIAVGRVAP